MFIHSQFQFSAFYWINIIFKHASYDKIKYLSIILYQLFLHLPYLQFPLFDYIKSNFMQIKEMNNLEMDAGSTHIVFAQIDFMQG